MEKSVIPLFTAYLRQYIDVSEKEVIRFLSFLSLKNFDKGSVIVREGDTARYQFFVLKGQIIKIQTDDLGKEHVSQFSFEKSWIGNLQNYVSEKPSNCSLIATEDCTLLLLSKNNYEKLLEQLPKAEKLFRMLFQNAYINQSKRVSMMLMNDAETRLQLFIAEYPLLVDKIEWKYVASYLKMKPETLSRLKKKLHLI